MLGKVALVTGAASGIGRAICRLLGDHGATVIAADIDLVGAEATAAGIDGARAARIDVADEAQWAALIADVRAREGRLDILVNNAAIGSQQRSTTPEDTTLDDWAEVLRINGDGVFLGCKHGIGLMREGAGGAIVNLSSIAALKPTPAITAYGFSKAGVAQLSRSVALFCAQKAYGIRCNSVHPGEIRTPMLDRLIDHMGEQLGIDRETAADNFRAGIPLGEFGEPDDIAYAVLYLASDEARHVTGTQLLVDGGLLLK